MKIASYIAGVEEAGRGPVIGPMLMVIAAIRPEQEEELVRMGVKDSKLLTPEQREVIFKKLQKLVVYKTRKLSPQEIDNAVLSDDMNLNWLEANVSADLINEIGKELSLQHVTLDCPSTNISAYTSYLQERVLDKKIKLIAEHKADVNYPIVSAASILAKVLRDREIAKIQKTMVENFGSGYPSDPRTVAFLKEHHKTYADAGIFRKSWSTYKMATSTQKQKRLGEY
ncbi:MAG: ribonuclease HII [archaeon]